MPYADVMARFAWMDCVAIGQHHSRPTQMSALTSKPCAASAGSLLSAYLNYQLGAEEVYGWARDAIAAKAAAERDLEAAFNASSERSIITSFSDDTAATPAPPQARVASAKVPALRLQDIRPVLAEAGISSTGENMRPPRDALRDAPPRSVAARSDAFTISMSPLRAAMAAQRDNGRYVPSAPLIERQTLGGAPRPAADEGSEVSVQECV